MATQEGGDSIPSKPVPSRRLIRSYAIAAGLTGLAGVSVFSWSGQIEVLRSGPLPVPYQIWLFAAMLGVCILILPVSMARRSDKWCREIVGVATFAGVFAAARALGQLFYVLPKAGAVDRVTEATWIAFAVSMLAVGLAISTGALAWTRWLGQRPQI